MSEAPKVLLKKPIILRKPSGTAQFVLPKRPSRIRNEVIYKINNNSDLFNGRYPNLNIVNKYHFNVLIQTVATYKGITGTIVLNSDEVYRVIGGKYEILLQALNSVDNEKLRIEGILALLTDKRANTADKYCQTLETSVASSNRKIRAKRCKAYVLHDSVNETIEDTPTTLKKRICKKPPKPDEDLMDLRLLLDDNSNLSTATDGNISLRSCHIPNIPVLLENPILLLHNSTIKDQERCNIPLRLVDGGTVMLRRIPEDFFHIASSDILLDLSDDDRRRVLVHQAYIDWKFCLQLDEEGNLPIHIAAMNNDIELLKRHCAILRSRDASLDIIGKESMTPLQLSVACASPAAVALLLRGGADVLQRDDAARSLLHLASDAGVECVDVIVDYCRGNARKILENEEDLWQQEFEQQTDEELAAYLLDHLCCQFDDSGSTPLMLASRRGAHAAAASLLRAAPRCVNLRTPTSGNTALYLAFQAAFIEAEQSCNKKIIGQNFLEIIEMLHEFGADPTITNDFGHSVAMLTADFKISELSQAIANKLLKVTSAQKNFDSYMLVKDKKGEINIELVTPNKKRKSVECNKDKEIIKFKSKEKVAVSEEKEGTDDDKKIVKKTVVFFKPNGNKEIAQVLKIENDSNDDSTISSDVRNKDDQFEKQMLPVQKFQIVKIENQPPKDSPTGTKIINKDQPLILPAVKLQNVNVASNKSVPLSVARVFNLNRQFQAKNPIKLNNVPIKIRKIPVNIHQVVNSANLNLSKIENSSNTIQPNAINSVTDNKINKGANSLPLVKITAESNVKKDLKRPAGCGPENNKTPRH